MIAYHRLVVRTALTALVACLAAGLPVTSGSTSARAEEPPPRSDAWRAEPGWVQWRDRLAATGAVDAACADLVTTALTVSRASFSPYPGVALAPEEGLVPDRMRGKLERIGEIGGAARITLGSRSLVVVAHSTGPVDSATSFWKEPAPGKLVAVATVPGQLMSVEVQGDDALLHMMDTTYATGARWRGATGAVEGVCHVAGLLGVVDEELARALPARSADVVVATVRRTKSKTRLYLMPGDEDASLAYPRHPALAAGDKVLSLHTRPDGWRLVLAPVVKATAETKVFPKGTRWLAGWVAPERLD